MSDNDKPRIDRVEATYFRKGKCTVCNKGTERTKTFEGATLAECDRQAKAWSKATLMHRRCER